ncbi:probable methyltransferase TARBP1 [Latimeria chalumnae]|uniref:probable methyltransferase TARBP1 n=1 Tax=Latimeria chalumnae TaxID=7897 RepID=UPI0003C16F1B|nr:PREDICTED: probable methyltransferase TARBP1 isoform X1 [Latimeria chalumnae]|eukprot:XP_006011684.1 PREDICTED: probable methyltransferase TARBP1 isoform X1 [Latimeria chalumnae]
MNCTLADLLVAGCKDICALLDELCWDGESEALPEQEKVEAIRLLIQRFQHRQSGSGRTAASEVPAAFRAKLGDIALKLCLPLLQRVKGPRGEGGSRAPLASAVCRLLACCAGSCGGGGGGGEAIQKVVAWAVAELLSGCEEASRGVLGAGGVEADLPVQVLASVVPGLSPAEDSALLGAAAAAGVATLKTGSDGAAAKVLSRLLPALLEKDEPQALAAAEGLWGEISAWRRRQRGSSAAVCRTVMCLSALSRYWLPAEARLGVFDLRPSAEFWEIVQLGLKHKDGICRKRAMYLLKGAVSASETLRDNIRSSQENENAQSLFWWSPEKNEILVNFWENYVLIMETLEENQVHVVRPVLPKINKLMEAALPDNESRPQFHMSWFTCIYKRMFDSENRAIIKEGVGHFLDLSVMKNSSISQEFAEFIVGPLMDALSDSSLYSRSAEQLMGSCPSLGVKLQRFFLTFVTSLPEESQGAFLLQLVHNLASRHWSSIPLVMICQALAHIPPCKAWGAEGLHVIRNVLQCTMITHHVLLRGAAQCFLLKTAMNLTDVERVTFPDVASFLMSLRTEESLCRGTILWTELCEWLHVNDRCFSPKDADAAQLGKSELNAFVQELIKTYLEVPVVQEPGSNVPNSDLFEAALVAKMILLAADVEERTKTKKVVEITDPSALSCFLSPLLDALRKLSTHAYLPTAKIDKSLRLLLKLLQMCSTSSATDKVMIELQEPILSTAPEILEYMLRRLMGELYSVSDLAHSNLYIAIMTELVNLHIRVGWKRGFCIYGFVSALTEASIHNLLKNKDEQEPDLATQIQKVVSMASLAWICEIEDQTRELQLDSLDSMKKLIEFISSAQCNQILRKPKYSEEINSFSEEAAVASKGWGKVVARFVQDQWVCLHFIVKKFSKFISSSAAQNPEHPTLPLAVLQRPVEMLQFALDALSILPSDHVLPVVHCMKILVPKVLEPAESLCVKAIDLSWKVILSLGNNQLYFWSTLEAFINFAFDHKLLSVDINKRRGIFAKLNEISRKIIEMSDTKTGMFNLLINHCCQLWMPTALKGEHHLEDHLTSARNYLEIFTEACIFGPVFRRDQRIIQDVHTYIENLGEHCAANVAIKSSSRDDQYVRIYAIDFLCCLDGSNQIHKMFIQDLVIQLLNKDRHITNAKVRYYGNSLQHRVKNRIWQTLLLLVPKLDQDFVKEVLERIHQAGFANNQPSVKYLIEWVLILIMHRYPQFLDLFWECFTHDEDKLKTSICTFLSVLAHVEIILQNTLDKKQVLKKALDIVLPWCFHHNFNVRLYALVALKKVWIVCKRVCEDDFTALVPVIESSLKQLESMQGTGNAKRNWLRIQGHFFFGVFQPLKDFSLETIFCTFPNLSGLAEEESIPVWKLSKFIGISASSAALLNNSRRELQNLQNLSDWVQQDRGSCLSEEGNQVDWTDVQKKIIPWKNTFPDLDPELIYQERAAKLGKSSNGLIVVASLIDKETNLGGLCRTSEIFGASALVVGNICSVSDKQFQSLSVSAEQWLPVIEVKPSQLVEYLEKKKTEGYTIVGVEQTANSQDLSKYCFPEKTLLLLGNEREGIPVNLIHHLDVCVEIPQQGIIRSLNVHVSGALLIWEYTRQQIMKQNCHTNVK